MADAITFVPYLGWVDVPNPNEPPASARFITAADLKRYETFGRDASALLNAHDTSITAINASITTANSNVTAINTRLNNATTGLDSKAPKASPAFTGTVTGITAAMVGLGSVNNTADTAKPVSTAQKTYIDAVGTRVTTVEGKVTTLEGKVGDGVIGKPTALLFKNTSSPMTTAGLVAWNVNNKLRGLTINSALTILTVQKAGIYSVIAKLAQGSESGTLSLGVEINGAIYTPASNDMQSTPTAWAKIVSGFDLALNAGDTIAVRNRNAVPLSTIECSFSVRYVDSL